MSSTSLENLSRLASKPGVQSTLILSKLDGAIIRSTGLLSDKSSSESPTPDSRSPGLSNGLADGNSPGLDHVNGEAEYGKERNESAKSAEDVARMVFSFVSAAGGLVDGLDDGDDIKLLRLRTRKSEMVIVPGQ
ncbi:hypothetical protein MMC24_005977 [Lignoscripta atroalba]|nr:hypothetical protein [Lignoscripta atroalba]